ncbi:hypothetical protein FKM82_027968 [Ascaphus truei]
MATRDQERLKQGLLNGIKPMLLAIVQSMNYKRYGAHCTCVLGTLITKVALMVGALLCACTCARVHFQYSYLISYFSSDASTFWPDK